MSFRLWLQRQFEPHREPTWQEERQLVVDAVKANDEKQLRALWRRLDYQIVSDEPRRNQARKAIFAGRSFGQWLVNNGRFPEAELVLRKVSTRLFPYWYEKAHVLFLMADAIWGQNERSRAEREALTPLQELLARFPDDDYTLRWRANVASYRFHFEEQAQYLEQSFLAPVSTYMEPLSPLQITRNHLVCATAWTKAGCDSRARAQLEGVLVLDSPFDQVLRAQQQLFFLEIKRCDYEKAREVTEQVVELAGEGEQLVIFMRAVLAMEVGDLDGCDSLLATLDGKTGAITPVQSLNLTARSHAKRGDFSAARRLYRESGELVPPVPHQSGYLQGLIALDLAELEMGAHAQANEGDLNAAKLQLATAYSLLRGDVLMEGLIRANEIVLAALLGQHEVALEKVPFLERQFEQWDDSPATQMSLGAHLLNLFESCGESAQVLCWGERLAQKWPHKPHRPSTLLTLAKAHERLGDSAKARDLCERAAQGNPNLLAVRMARALLEA